MTAKENEDQIFNRGERVLCYEPDDSKARVLYASKVTQSQTQKYRLTHTTHTRHTETSNTNAKCTRRSTRVFTPKNLFSSQVLAVYEKRNEKNLRYFDYKIHFQGWSSTWDRIVRASCLLKDNEENRKLQRELAEAAQVQK